MSPCARCEGAHGPAYPLAADAVDLHSGAPLAAGTALCLHCTCLVRDAAPTTNERAEEPARGGT